MPDIERCIRTIKERTRSTYTMLPFKCVPRLMLIHLVKNAVLWINALPARDGVSNRHSPRYILTGRELNADTHAVIEFGSYVQTHEEHTNNMDDRTLAGICLGPTGNDQGGHWFLSLTSGSRVMRYKCGSLAFSERLNSARNSEFSLRTNSAGFCVNSLAIVRM